MSTTSDLIIERLLEWGVGTCFGICGDAVNGFFESLRTHADRMRFVHVRHEEASSLAATGYAKFSGRPAACVATGGPGAVHLLNGVYDARMDGAPLIAITGMPYHDVIDTHFLQDLHSDRLFADACVYSQRVMGPAHAVNAIDRAVRRALADRGPAHLAIPIDVQTWTGDEPSVKNRPGHTSLAPQSQVQVPPADLLEAASEVLNACQRVAIVAGAGARGAGELVEQVAEKLAAPVVKAGLGKDAVPDDSPYCTGGMGLIGTRASHKAFENCDGFFIIGSSTPFYEFWPRHGQARGVQIDIDPARIGLRYPVEVGLAGETKVTLEQLLPLLEPKQDRSFLKQAQASARAGHELLKQQASARDVPMKPQVVTWHLGELLPEGAILTGDAGTVTMWSSRVRLRRGMQFSFSGTHCSMGSAVPYAIGAQVAYPDRTVVAFTGDGSMSMGMGELATLAQNDLPVKVIVMRNDSLALEVWEQNAFLGNPQFGCELAPIEFAKVAEACGIRGLKVDEPGDVPDILAEALAHDGPILIEAVVDPYEAPFGETLKPSHAEKLIEAFERGEPARKRMAASLRQPDRVRLSPGVQAVEEQLRRY